MKTQPEDTMGRKGLAGARETEATLRLIAELPAPEGLENRVKAALKREPAGRQGKLLDWPARSWAQNTWMRGAAAAAIVLIVAGGSWGVYSRVQPGLMPIAVPQVRTGGFSSANAMRTPKTLEGPTVTHPLSHGAAPAKRPERGKRIGPGMKVRADQAATGSASK